MSFIHLVSEKCSILYRIQVRPLSYRYGVTETFEVEDLLERRNIPKVTKCLAQLSKLVSIHL